MSTTLRRGRHRARRSAARIAASALLLSTAATLSAIAPTDDPATGAAPGRPAVGDTRRPLVRAESTVAGRPAAPPVPAAAVAPVAPVGTPRPAVVTMSMDVPIQGGLTGRQAQAASAAVRAAHDDVATAPGGTTWTPAMGRAAAARARSWLGLPYAWAGGSAGGPTPGRCEVGNGADLDCHIVGFDCSGLMMYAWGAYTSLPHFAESQRESGAFHPAVEQLRAGDMVFFAGYLPGGIGHVAIYDGEGMVIEAPQSGDVVRRSSLADLMANDGAYRGAVRPLTTAAPVLAAKTPQAPRSGGAVTLRGAHLAGVTSLRVGGRTVDDLTRQSDSAITFRVPAGTHRLTVTATTSWGASSAPVTLTYAAAPRPAPATEAAPTRGTSPSTVAPQPTVPPRPSPPKSTAPPKPTAPPSSSTSSPAPSPTTSAVPDRTSSASSPVSGP